LKLIINTAFRYTFSNAENQKRSTIVIIIGVCISLVAMLVLSSVMNGLQTTQLDRLRNLDSFDIVVENSNLKIEDLAKLDDVEYVYEFIDANVLISNITTGKSSTARIRGIDLSKYLNSRTENDFSYKLYDSEAKSQLTLSTTMQNRFNVKIGDQLQVTYLKKGKTTVAPYNRSYSLSGLYVCSISDFSSNNAFIDISELINIYGIESVKIGIFCTNDVDSVVSILKNLDSNAKIISWKEANRALYSALMLEKSLMYLFIGFVFIIISVNLKNSTRRLLDNKVNESAILRACGMSKLNIYLIFILQGIFATSIGSLSGLIIGFFIVKNLGFVLKWTDRIINSLTGSTSYLSSLPLNAFFNIKEALFAVLYIFVLTVVFSYLGCRKINKLQVMEVLSSASY